MNGGYIDERRRVKKIAVCKCNISHAAGTFAITPPCGGEGFRRAEFVPILRWFSFPHWPLCAVRTRLISSRSAKI
jgi:hypothetical protein